MTKLAAKKKAAKAGAAAVAVKNSPYVQRVVEDEDLRQNLVAGLRVRPRRRLAPQQRQVAREGDLRRQEAAEGPQERGRVVPRRERRPARGAQDQRKGLSFGRLLLLTIVGGAVALAVSEGLRKKVLDALFGAEEEFEYTSTTTSTPPPEPATSPATESSAA